MEGLGVAEIRCPRAVRGAPFVLRTFPPRAGENDVVSTLAGDAG